MEKVDKGSGERSEVVERNGPEGLRVCVDDCGTSQCVVVNISVRYYSRVVKVHGDTW